MSPKTLKMAYRLHSAKPFSNLTLSVGMEGKGKSTRYLKSPFLHKMPVWIHLPAQEIVSLFITGFYQVAVIKHLKCTFLCANVGEGLLRA